MYNYVPQTKSYIFQWFLTHRLEKINEEYDDAFFKVKFWGVLEKPDLDLCSDAVNIFLKNCTNLIQTIEVQTEKFRTSLTNFEADSYGGTPGIIVWAQLVFKTIVVSNCDALWKERVGADLRTLFQIHHQTETSAIRHELVLKEFQEYVEEFIQQLCSRDKSCSQICAEVIPKDHFSNVSLFET